MSLEHNKMLSFPKDQLLISQSCLHFLVSNQHIQRIDMETTKMHLNNLQAIISVVQVFHNQIT